uniref:Putative secreted protein n=1 Tax=Anopheles triannulatus TaxID=58253 RepID=A0A2M4B393_9DIPT
MRRAPSRRMTSPFSSGLSTIACTSCAYSEGSPSRCGNGMVLARNARTFSGSACSMGVLNSPGAIVTIRMPCVLRSRAIGRVIPTTAAFDAEYAACPICPS